MAALNKIRSCQCFQVLNVVEINTFGIIQIVWFVISLIYMKILLLIFRFGRF